MATKSRVGEQLESLRKQLEMERDDVLRKTAPLHRQREAIIAKIQPLEAQLREVDEKIKDAEKPLYEIGNGLAQLARAGGARVMANGEEEPPQVDGRDIAKVIAPPMPEEK